MRHRLPSRQVGPACQLPATGHVTSLGTGLPAIRSSVPLQVRAARLPSIRSPAALPVMAPRPAGNPASVRAISQGCQACRSSGHQPRYLSWQPGLLAIQPASVPSVRDARHVGHPVTGRATCHGNPACKPNIRRTCPRHASWELPCGISPPVSMALFYLR